MTWRPIGFVSLVSLVSLSFVTWRPLCALVSLVSLVSLISSPELISLLHENALEQPVAADGPKDELHV